MLFYLGNGYVARNYFIFFSPTPAASGPHPTARAELAAQLERLTGAVGRVQEDVRSLKDRPPPPPPPPPPIHPVGRRSPDPHFGVPSAPDKIPGSLRRRPADRAEDRHPPPSPQRMPLPNHTEHQRPGVSGPPGPMLKERRVTPGPPLPTSPHCLAGQPSDIPPPLPPSTHLADQRPPAITTGALPPPSSQRVRHIIVIDCSSEGS